MFRRWQNVIARIRARSTARKQADYWARLLHQRGSGGADVDAVARHYFPQRVSARLRLVKSQEHAASLRALYRREQRRMRALLRACIRDGADHAQDLADTAHDALRYLKAQLGRWFAAAAGSTREALQAVLLFLAGLLMLDVDATELVGIPDAIPPPLPDLTAGAILARFRATA